MSLGNEEFCNLALKCRLDFCLPDATSSQKHTQVEGHKLARRGKALTVRRTLLRKLVVASLVTKHIVFDIQGFFLTQDRAGTSNAEQEAPSFALQQQCHPLYGEQSHTKKGPCIVEIFKAPIMSGFVNSMEGFRFKMDSL